MSLIARCPACGTLFRVVPDQLKISDGWVRCGQCAEVFDANQSLQQVDSAASQAPAREDAGEPANPARDELLEPASRAVSEAEARIDELAVPPELTAPAAPELPDPPAPPLVDPDPREPVLEPGPLLVESDGVAEPTSAQAQPAAQVDESQQTPPTTDFPHPVADTAPVAPAVSADRAAQDLSFVRQARRRAFWRRRGVRAILAVLAAGLSVLLAGQVAYHQRDRLASELPVLQPALAALCEALGCRLGAPQRIEAIAIESSAFTRLRADAFRLNLTLNNQSDIALAVPALELTLTDLQDQPVLRRVLQPAELGPGTPSVIAARTEWSSTLTVAIGPGVDPARIVGYRVLAFYP